MDECYGKYFIRNGEKLSSDLFSSSLVYEGDSVYEVIRMVKGIPVFFEDHMMRLKNSASLQKKELGTDTDTIRRDIIMLTNAEKTEEVNLKIVFNYNEKSSGYLIYFIEPVYPTRAQYRNGVKGILFNAERKDPASKVINHKLRSDIYHKLILGRAYEALLVDHKNRITEGSRSNIFFIRDNVLYTAPDEIILSGITRKYILDICLEKNLKVIFEPVKADEIHDYDSVFMTGTSPMVLPFRTVNDFSFNVRHPLISELRSLYIKRAADSIRNFRSE
ncbi:MAG: aminotransferase class IV family protein [Bacteroidia bacterium]|nr:aminotransferase class IV family protein [Bacteroidia bacterium]